MKRIERGVETTVTYTYSVYWGEDVIPPLRISLTSQKTINYGNRWDLFFINSDPKIHWYGILNSVSVVGALSIVVAIVALGTIRRDLEVYNDPDKVREG